MSEVNTNIWGASEYWQDAAFGGSWDVSLDDKQRIQYAGVSDGYTLHNNSRVWGSISSTPLDNTLSYCGLGTEAPLSHIKFYAGGYGYPIGYGNDLTYEQLCKAVRTEDDRDITNFAFTRIYSNYLVRSRYAQMISNPQFNSKSQRWLPDSTLNTNTDGYAYNAAMLARVPVKNAVLVPYVIAFNSVSRNDPTVVKMDLKTYCDTGYSSYPYISSVVVRMYTSSDQDNFEAHNRNDIAWLNGISLYGETNMVAECNADSVSPPDKTGLVTDYFYSYSVTDYDIPIMGKLTSSGSNSPDRVISKYETCMTYTEDWSLLTLTDGGVSVFAWAGDEPLEYWHNVGQGQSAANDSAHFLYWHIGSGITIAEFKDKVLHAVACFGLFFVESESDVNVALDDNKMMLGILVDGVGHGDYSHGADNREQLQWDMDDMHETDYDPSNPPAIDPNTYDGEMQTGILDWYSSATVRYVMYSSQVAELTSKLWDCLALLPAGDPMSDYAMNTFLTTNPIDCIVSLKYFPINTLDNFLIEDPSDPVNIMLGKYDTEIGSYKAKTTVSYDCGSITIFPRGGNGKANWLDKMTNITLYLPFCGTLKLDPEIYMGREVNVEYLIDLITGACTAIVSITADNGRRCITDTATGSCCIDIPVTGLQQATLESQLYNAAENLKGMRVNGAIQGLTAIFGVAKGASSQDLLGTLSSIGSAGSTIYNVMHSEKVAEYNLEHTMLPIKMIGTNSAATGAMCSIYPTIIFERPVMPDALTFSDEAYAASVGYACCRSDTVSAFTGYTEFASVVLDGFSATAAEKSAIAAALKSGVIL